MGVPTQATGTAAESISAAATAGFLGWSPEAGRSAYTVRNGGDGTAPTAYANATAYAVGKTVTSGGLTYVVKTAVTSGNSTPPASNSSFKLVDDHRGGSETATRRAQYYR